MRVASLLRGPALIAGILLIGLVGACAPAKPGQARIPDGAKVTHRAAFIGESNHDTTGTVSIYQSDQPAVIVFEQNFSLSHSPDLVIALGRDGFRPEAVVAELFRTRGRQAYALPQSLEIKRYNEVWIWSRQTNRPLGLARLTQL